MAIQTRKIVPILLLLLSAGGYRPSVSVADELPLVPLEHGQSQNQQNQQNQQEQAVIAELNRLEEQKRLLEQKQQQLKMQWQAMTAARNQAGGESAGNGSDGAAAQSSALDDGVRAVFGQSAYVLATFLVAIGLGFAWRKFSSGRLSGRQGEAAEAGDSVESSRVTGIENLQPAPTDILVVEDNVVNQKLLVRMIEKMGYQAGTAGNGKEALAALAQKPYGIVLMDCQMPEMHGFEATAQIRQHDAQAGTHTIIIAVTAQTMPGMREDCFKAGMDEYLAKPLKPQTLRDTLARFAPPLVASEKETHKQPAVSLPPPCNISEALVHIDGDTELLQEMAEIFLAECPHFLEQIQTAIATNDVKELVAGARTLKVSVSNFVASEAFEAAALLEKIGMQGKLDQAPQAVARLEKALGRLRPALSELKQIAA